MFGKDRRWPAAALAGGVALAVWVGCGGEPSVASKSAAAFREAQKKGETFEGSEHSHGHGAVTPGGANPEESASGHDHGQAEAAPDHAAMGHGGEGHGGHAGDDGHAGMDHGQSGQDRSHAAHSGAAKRDEHAGHATRPSQDGQTGHSGHAAQDPHAGHDMSPQTPPSGGHAGHSADPTMDHGEMDHGEMDHGEMAPAPVAVSPGQPAKTLSPDPLDAPAATSVQDAQRSAEMAEEMSGGGGHEGHGGHGGHGTTGTYRQTDAGRGPEAHEGSEPRTPGHDSHQHGAEDEAAASYVCPMHPEVTSAEPGKCSKCGMDLVKRRKG